MKEQLRFEMKNGELFGYGKYIHWKIDTNRRVYDKKADSNHFKFTDIKIQKNASRPAKQMYLNLLNNHVVEQNDFGQDGQDSQQQRDEEV